MKTRNPWLSLIAAILLVFLLATQAGCTTTDSSHPSARFAIEKYDMDGSVYGACIITDQETGVQYLVYKTPHGTSMTVLLEGDDTHVEPD